MKAIETLLKPRTIISFGLYGAFIYLSVTGKIPEQAIIAVVSVMMGHYFSERSKKDLTKPS